MKLKRRQAKLTQKQISLAMRVKLRQIQRWEAGEQEIPIHRLFEFGELVNTPAWFFVYQIDIVL